MFAVTRRVCVDLNSIRGAKKTWTQGMDPSVFNIVIGRYCSQSHLEHMQGLRTQASSTLLVGF